MNEFTFPCCFHNAGSPQNPKVLRGDGLFQAEGIVNFVDVDRAIFINELDDSEPQRMRHGTEHFGRNVEFLPI